MRRGGGLHMRPTRHCIGLALALGATLMAAMNYASNAAWLLAFLLASLAITSTLHATRNLASLRVAQVTGQPTFSGDPLNAEVELANARRRASFGIELSGPDGTRASAKTIPAAASTALILTLPPRPRGIFPLAGISIASRYPLGLLRVSRYSRQSFELVVYPRPDGNHLAASADTGNDAADDSGHEGVEDFSGHRLHQAGDSQRRVDWKAEARGGPLLVKRYTGGSASEVWLDWAQTGGDIETRLSQLARWVIDAENAGRRYGLRLPAANLTPDLGTAHRHACLRALAAYPNAP